MDEREWSPTIGVSAIVALRVALTEYPVGMLAMVVRQRPAMRYRYELMFPGDPLTIWQPAENLRVVQGIASQDWWRRPLLNTTVSRQPSRETHAIYDDDAEEVGT